MFLEDNKCLLVCEDGFPQAVLSLGSTLCRAQGREEIRNFQSSTQAPETLPGAGAEARGLSGQGSSFHTASHIQATDSQRAPQKQKGTVPGPSLTPRGLLWEEEGPKSEQNLPSLRLLHTET